MARATKTAPLLDVAPALEIEGARVPVTLRVNRRARRLIVRVMHQSGEVVVVAPSKRALKDALAFAAAQKRWIAKRLSEVVKAQIFAPDLEIPLGGRAHKIVHRPYSRSGVLVRSDLIDGARIEVSGELRHLPRRVEDYLKKEARRLMCERTRAHCAALGLAAPRIALRDPSTRWGSCSRKSGISYSWRLVMAPLHVADYVAAHEVAHLVHMNHAPAFWRVVGTLVTEPRAAKDWLAAHGRGLHRFRSRP